MRKTMIGCGLSGALAAGLLPTAAHAAAVRPGGSLELEISGHARFLAALGQRDRAQLDDELSSGPDFFNDTEVHVLLKGEDERTGLGYGGHIELEADTNATGNADETWLFLEGPWGELRLGDQDGIADIDGMALSAASIAAGTGGLDGDVVEVFGGGVRTYDAIGTSDATKILYQYHPKAGLRLGLSYTPNTDELDSGSGNGDSLAARNVEAGDIAEAALGYAGEFGGVEVEAALSGLYGDIKDRDDLGGRQLWAAQAGLVVEFLDVKVAGSFLAEEAGGIEARAITLGAAIELGKVDLSLNYGRIVGGQGLEEGGNRLDQPWTVVLSADVGLMPGLTLAGDLAWFDNDVRGEVEGVDDDEGWQGVVRLGLAF